VKGKKERRDEERISDDSGREKRMEINQITVLR
jgi:hypothetical protein